MQEPQSWIDYEAPEGWRAEPWGASEDSGKYRRWFENFHMREGRRTIDDLWTTAQTFREFRPGAKIMVDTGSYGIALLVADELPTQEEIDQREAFAVEFAKQRAEFERERDLKLLKKLKAKYETTDPAETPPEGE